MTLGEAAVLNSKPAGALSTSVTPEPEPKSGLFLSAMIIGPSVVHAGEDALAALSDRILVPPVAAVMVTAPKAELVSWKAMPKTKRLQGKTLSVPGRIDCARSEFNADCASPLLVTKIPNQSVLYFLVSCLV